MPGLLRNASDESLTSPSPSLIPRTSAITGDSRLSDIREAIAAHDFLINRYDALYREITLVERELALVRRVLQRRAPSPRIAGDDHDEDADNERSAASALLQELLEDHLGSDEDEEQEPVDHDEALNSDPPESEEEDTQDDLEYLPQGRRRGRTRRLSSHDNEEDTSNGNSSSVRSSNS